VIAVTATDVADKLFTGANRGKYISVAAPGVDILVPAPENNYQLTTGTSVAAAEVSGIVALLLERNPKLTPADIRRILTASARRLGSADRDDDFGSGLIDPLKALQLADPRIVSTAPPSAPTPTPASAPAGTLSPTLRQRLSAAAGTEPSAGPPRGANPGPSQHPATLTWRDGLAISEPIICPWENRLP
jgi:subtilisin family serine protease